MPGTILFITPPATGHLHATYGLARLLLANGYKIVYALPTAHHAQVIKKGFECVSLEGMPFAANGEKLLDEVALQHRLKYFDSLMDRFYDTLFTSRKEAIGEVLRIVRPDIVLLDSFQPTDFILLYPFLRAQGIRFAFLQAMLSYHEQPDSLPLDCTVIPGNSTSFGWYWKKYFFQRWLRNTRDSFIWLGRNNSKLVRRKFRQQNIDPRYQINTKQIFRVGFENIPEFITSPHELEFSKSKKEHQHYLGLSIDFARKETEEISEKYLGVVNTKKPLIFCSLGTLYTHAKKEKPIHRFFSALLKVAQTMPDCEFVVNLNQEFVKKLPSPPPNVHFFDQIPQLDLLARCKVFVTHGGLQSVKESIANRVPMLAYPVWWDQFGYAARIAYYGLGLTDKLGQDNPKVMKEKIEKLLSDNAFQETLDGFGATVSEKYSSQKVIDIFESVIAEAEIM